MDLLLESVVRSRSGPCAPPLLRTRRSTRREIDASAGLFRGLGADALFLLAQLRGEGLSEILGLEDPADLDLGIACHWIRAALDPFDRLFHRLALPDPETGDQFLGLGERSVDDGTLGA